MVREVAMAMTVAMVWVGRRAMMVGVIAAVEVPSVSMSRWNRLGGNSFWHGKGLPGVISSSLQEPHKEQTPMAPAC